MSKQHKGKGPATKQGKAVTSTDGDQTSTANSQSGTTPIASSSTSASHKLSVQRMEWFAKLPKETHDAILYASFVSGEMPMIYASREFKAISQNFSGFSNPQGWWMLLRQLAASSDIDFKAKALKVVDFAYKHLGMKEFPLDQYNGDTLSHFAAKYDIAEITKLLESKSQLSLDVKNAEGLQPIQYCQRKFASDYRPKEQKLHFTETGQILWEKIGRPGVNKIKFAEHTPNILQEHNFKQMYKISEAFSAILSGIFKKGIVADKDVPKLKKYIDTNMGIDFFADLRNATFALGTAKQAAKSMEGFNGALTSHLLSSVAALFNTSSIFAPISNIQMLKGTVEI